MQREGGREEEDAKLKGTTKESLQEALLFPASTVSTRSLCHQQECQVVSGNSRQARASCRRSQKEWGDSLCEAVAGRWCEQMALLKALLLQRVFPFPMPEGESSQMLLLGLSAAMESADGERAGTSGSHGGNQPLFHLAWRRMRDGSN